MDVDMHPGSMDVDMHPGSNISTNTSGAMDIDAPEKYLPFPQLPLRDIDGHPAVEYLPMYALSFRLILVLGLAHDILYSRGKGVTRVRLQDMCKTFKLSHSGNMDTMRGRLAKIGANGSGMSRYMTLDDGKLMAKNWDTLTARRPTRPHLGPRTGIQAAKKALTKRSAQRKQALIDCSAALTPAAASTNISTP